MTMPAIAKHDWSVEEPKIRQLHEDGVDPANIAKQLRIGPTTIRERMIEWGLIEPKPRAKPLTDGVLETTERLPIHTLAGIFPLMTGQPYQELKEDIRLHGQREPGWVHDGQLLDGRNRHSGCLELGIPFQYRIYKGNQPLEFIVSLNLQRRHLTDSQRAMIGAKLANMRQGERTDLTENSVRLSQGQAAELMKVSV